MTVELTPEAVEKMLEGVTPGPWRTFETGVYFDPNSGTWGGFDLRNSPNAESNARFIAWAREAVPALAAERDAIAARLAEVEAQKREMALQSLADLGQAQEAYEAQLAAEDENARLRAELAEARAVQGAAKVLLTEVPKCPDAAFVAGAQWGLSHFEVGSVVGAFLNAIAKGGQA